MLKFSTCTPAGTVTVAGTLATDGSLLVTETVMPPAGAGPFKMIWPVVGFPPVTPNASMF